MKNKARELKGSALDRAVAKAKDIPVRWEFERGEAEGDLGRLFYDFANPAYRVAVFRPSTNWSQGGPLIEEHSIELMTNTGEQHADHERWYAVVPTSASGSRSAMGPTPLIAAMRALVFAKLGDEIEIPSLP